MLHYKPAFQRLTAGTALAAVALTMSIGVAYASRATWGDGGLYPQLDDEESNNPATGWIRDIKTDGHCVDLYVLRNGSWQFTGDRECNNRVQNFWQAGTSTLRVYRSDMGRYFTLRP